MTLEELADQVFSISVEFNEHRNYHETVSKYGKAWRSETECDKAIRTQRVCRIQVYPKTAVSCFIVDASTLEAALAAAVDILIGPG